MKSMKKLFAVLIALAMVLALGVTAFAAEETGSITIVNPQEGKTYTAYRIFGVTYSGVNYSYTINTADAAYATVAEYAANAANGLKLTANGASEYIVTIDSAKFSAASFANFLRDNQASLGAGVAFVKDGTEVKASNLELGYYFVAGTSGSVCELVTAKHVHIRDKNETPEIEKTVDDSDRTVEVGQLLTFTVTGKVPSTVGYTEYRYEVTDKMSAGLTFNDDVRITIGGIDVTEDITVDDIENGFVAHFDMKNYQDKVDAEVVITYTATVNEDAITRNIETNTATLVYSNDPSDKTSTETSTVEVDLYSFNIVIDKYRVGSEETKLPDAKFVLKNSEGRYYKYNTTAGKVEWVADKADADVSVTTIDGKAAFNGLEAGTYYLEEIAAPSGYNRLAGDIEIVIYDKDNATVAGNASNPSTANLSLTAKVANASGTILPETGGIGTIIFIVVGALAVIGAGIFLVTNKRISKESF